MNKPEPIVNKRGLMVGMVKVLRVPGGIRIAYFHFPLDDQRNYLKRTFVAGENGVIHGTGLEFSFGSFARACESEGIKIEDVP